MSSMLTRSKGSTIIAKPSKKSDKKLRSKIRIKKYQLLKKIGEGSFSWVYRGVSVSQPKKNVAIKTFFSTTDHKQALSQIQLLFSLRQKKRFPKLLDVDIIKQHIHIVYSLIQSSSFQVTFQHIQKFYKSAKPVQIKHYLYELLLGLSELKEAGIVHRDIKPSNFLYNKDTKRGFIIDFGFATKKDSIIKKIGIEKRKGTMAYMPIEVFLQGDYSYASDIWAVGIIMLELLIKKSIIFHTLSDNSQKLNQNQVSPFMQHLSHFLIQLALLTGNQEIINQCKLFGFTLQLPENIYGRGQNLKKVLSEFRHSENAVDLLQKLLEINPNKRIKVEDALTHSFFDDIRTNHDQNQ